MLLGAIVALNGLTAVIFIYRNSNKPEIQAQASESQLPEKRPPLDLANRIDALGKLAAQDPQNPDYPAQIGNLYYDAGEYGKAIDFYQRSLNIRPRDPNVETDLASCFHYLGQDDKAIETLDNVLSYSPGFAQAKFNKGIVLVEGKKDVKNGIAVWEDLLRSDPSYNQRAELERRIQQLRASAR